ncbi:SMP-30/gluconolactonase/LRE family protein [Streptomyces sp. NPDC002073]|uniref:SMP-30/gluconolactonase/LRE family protein n=1 Tax=Streptomyces sp. NBC_00239 TaxID=2903640 RepID=UPI002E2A5233|nr:twin-arginine translocation signal domain-containing protein [Streptomyces sp. NBC_00239]
MALPLSRRRFLGAAAAVGAGTLLGPLGTLTGTAHAAGARPTEIATPPGFQPEGIAIGRDGLAYTGSIIDGSIYCFDPATGRGEVITRGTGPISVGLKTDPYGRLLVAGGGSGQLRVVDPRTGRVLATHQAVTGTAFVNDVVVGCGAAWFTDSFNDVLYRLSLRHGREAQSAEVTALPLSGAWAPTPPGGEFWGANGIARTPDGRALLVVSDHAEALFRVDPRTGAATRTVLDGGAVGFGDGLVVHGRTLYVVRNWKYVVEVFRISPDGSRAEFVRQIADTRFDEPTTAAVHGGRLYVVNARFDADWSDPKTSSTVVSVPLRTA